MGIRLTKSKIHPDTTPDDSEQNIAEKLPSIEVGPTAKSQREVPLFLDLPEFPYSTAQDRSIEASVPKMSSIRSTVSTQYRRVTKRQTHTHDDR